MFKKLVSVLAFFLPSGLTCLLFRAVGYKVGRNTKLALFSYIHAKEIDLGNDVDIRPLVFVANSSLVLGSNTIISFGTQIKGAKGFKTGDNCFVGPYTLIHCDEQVTFGFYSGVGPRCMIYTHGSFLPITMGYPAVFSEVVLEDFVWVAMGVLFLPGARVESRCIITPGVVVSGQIEANSQIRIDPTTYRTIDQKRLSRFSRRKPDHYQQLIIRGFLASADREWKESEGGKLFSCPNGLRFRSIPEDNLIEHWQGSRRVAVYDLANYYTGQSNNALHRRFLAYIRRRFGLTLRTKYP